jgi:hypothetical protein
MHRFSTFALSAISLGLLILVAPAAHAIIEGHIDADITHPFIVANTTLPAGHYVFRMLPGSDLQLMTIASKDGNTSVEVMVRPSVDSHTPQHTDLVFNRYGKKEILKDIYESGQKTGVAIADASHEEAQLQKQGDKPFQHTEQQQP